MIMSEFLRVVRARGYGMRRTGVTVHSGGTYGDGGERYPTAALNPDASE